MTTLSGRTERTTRRATMGDVARLAGVSIKTVSRVVNGEPGVHESTASRVAEAIERLGFRSNLGARNLRRGAPTATVGLLLEDVANPFYAGLTRAVEEVARGYGRRVLTASSDEDPDRARELALEFCARRVDGLLVVPAGERHDYLLPEINSGTPMVFLDRPPGDVTADTVLVDNIGGAAAAVTHLAAHGHRRIAFFGDACEIYTAAQRLHGFREGCVTAGVEYRHDLVVMGPHDNYTVDIALATVLDRPDAATALVTGNNRITVHVLRALARRHRRPALVGFDDFELADLLDPPVTVIAHDPSALGRTAAELLFTRLGGDNSPSKQIVLDVRILPRGSGEVAPEETDG